MLEQRALDFERTDAVRARRDHVVGSADEPEVPVVVDLRAVAGEVPLAAARWPRSLLHSYSSRGRASADRRARRCRRPRRARTPCPRRRRRRRRDRASVCPSNPGARPSFAQLATSSEFSVWPYPSRIVRPNAAFQRARTSGLSGSPAETQCRSLRQLPALAEVLELGLDADTRSALGTSIVTPRSRIRSIRSTGTKPPSCSTIGVPHDHGPSSTFQSDFAQPVPAVHQSRSSGFASSQNSACMRLA